MKIFKIALMASVVAAGMGSFSAGPVAAFPLGPVVTGLAAQLDDAAPVTEVYYRGWGGYRGGFGGYRGFGVGPAIIGGLVLGGIIASQRPYYGYPGYYGYSGNSVGYCMSRFKSYDPNSGTYLGYDGYRHPCP